MLYYLLLSILSLLHTTSSNVYYVIPDDHYTTNNNTYTLRHYLSNISKYFTSHTQLHFLPGQYYLNSDLIIQHVSNLSLIGNRTNEVINSVIKCTSPAGIVVVGSSNIVIANIVMKECGNNYTYLMRDYPFDNMYQTSLFAINCRFITIKYFISVKHQQPFGVRLINVVGNLTRITTNYMIVWYNSAKNTTYTLQISYCQLSSQVYNKISENHALEIYQSNAVSTVMITIEYMNFTCKLAILNICSECAGHSIITINHCYFTYKEKSKDISYDYGESDDDYFNGTIYDYEYY